MGSRLEDGFKMAGSSSCGVYALARSSYSRRWLVAQMFGVSGSGLDLPSALLLLKISLTALSALRFLVSSFTFSK